MCGVIGLVYKDRNPAIGLVAAELLKMLEYRGYDSTGAAIQDGSEVWLRKGVGAPSAMVHSLGVTSRAGRVMAGQVRWATFGAVDQKNSQPHEVRCKTHIYGAHNGNVTNCDDLKVSFTADGHHVLSDNDGEMVIHAVEHHFGEKLEVLKKSGLDLDPDQRRAAMRAAIVDAARVLKGSYAAVIVDPVTSICWSVKAGSSLYFGVGRDEAGPFTLASSDLSSILKRTRFLVPLSESEFVEHDGSDFTVHALRAKGSEPAGARLERTAKRSRLRARDTSLRPEFRTFMEQEIEAQVMTSKDVVTSFLGGSKALELLRPHLMSAGGEVSAALDRLVDSEQPSLGEALSNPAVSELLAGVPSSVKEQLVRRENMARERRSSESGALADLISSAKSPDERLLICVFDALRERAEQDELDAALSELSSRIIKADESGRQIFVLSCGSSFHAAKAGALFFDEIARVPIFPVLPGELRGQYGHSIREGDVVVVISQSGETKDVIDLLNQLRRDCPKALRVALVNNVNSTIGQELTDLVIPLRCGPEIAVAATKSFVNQMTVLFGLALRVGRDRAPLVAVDRESLERGLDDHQKQFLELPGLIRRTLDTTKDDVERLSERLFLRPSLHILATKMLAVAKEGALKIREVVLNHTEGFEASEFKHGPNTILGRSTVFGLGDIQKLLSIVQASGSKLDLSELLEKTFSDYPLVYLTGPDQRDIDLTVSQINTHKIRGSSTLVIAEPNAQLKQAAQKPPGDNPNYQWDFVSLPATGQTLSTVFSATVVLQRLALRMSERKANYLDSLGIQNHGVHPDVPKNVSKSITVD